LGLEGGFFEFEDTKSLERELKVEELEEVEDEESQEIRGIERPIRSRTEKKIKGPVKLEGRNWKWVEW